MADQSSKSGLLTEVLTIRMHTKVTKGGRNLSFAALVAVGNGNGKVGIGYGKAPGVPMAIEKANARARDEMVEVPLIGDTVGHEQVGEHKSSRVIIKPAAPGTGVKAGRTVRSILQTLGVHNVLTKSVGRNNPLNVAQATMSALKSMRSLEELEKLRGKTVYLRHPQWTPPRKKQAEDQASVEEEVAEGSKGKDAVETEAAEA